MKAWVSLFACCLLADTQLPLGQIIDDVPTAADSKQSYSLYLPSSYTTARTWPLILAFDPGGRGRRAVEAYQAAAEKFGYVIAASNVSRNGSWQVSMTAAQAMGGDVTTRFAIDRQRVYTAGMSGGSRVALGVAMGSGTSIAGVVASSAGYPDSKPRKTLPFVVFGTAGTEDFNWLEMRTLDHALTSPHHLAVFDGGHVWLSSELAIEAVDWLDLQAMKANRLERDAARLDHMFATRQAAATALTNELDRCEALEALAADFAGLRDITAVSTQANTLRGQKTVKEALKRAMAEEAQESRLLNEIMMQERGLNVDESRGEAFMALAGRWKRLSSDANAAADSATRRIARRVTRGLAMGASERTSDAEYLKLLAGFRTFRGPAR